MLFDKRYAFYFYMGLTLLHNLNIIKHSRCGKYLSAKFLDCVYILNVVLWFTMKFTMKQVRLKNEIFDNYK